MSAWDAIAARANEASLRVFGESISYQHGSSDPIAVSGVWTVSDDPKYSARVWVPAASLPEGFAKNDHVTRGEIVYRVTGFLDGENGGVSDLPHVDGSGAVTLIVHGPRKAA